MEKIKIREVAVIGSGIMGSRIACHLVNVGLRVLLLDVAPKELNEDEKRNNKKITDKDVRNRIVNFSLQTTIKSKPSPLFIDSLHQNIKTGNIEDDISLVSKVDWIIEAVVENLNIKKSVYDLIEKHRKKQTLIATNTSGIPRNQIAEGSTLAAFAAKNGCIRIAGEPVARD